MRQRTHPRPKTVHRKRSLPQAVVLGLGRSATRAYGMATAGVRPAPDFLLIGAKRGGTTSAYFHILTHPHVLPLFPSAKHMPGRSRDAKGSHYFSSEYDRGPRWFASHFPSAARRALAERTSGARPVCGEASPYYLFHPLAAARAAAAVPQAKLLVALRDPVERTYSHWREQTRNQVETLSFEDALAAEADRVGDAEQRLAEDPDFYSFGHEHQSYAAQSAYARSLRRWLEVFPREQLHVWASEDYYADSNATIAAVCEFLGLQGRELPPKEPLNAAPRSPLDEEVRRQLVERFTPDVRAVEELLGRRMPWPNFA